MFLKNLLKKIRSPKGFTFIELLIAIAIISIMVSIGAVSFSAAQRQGRDAQRKSDLEKIAGALEQFYADFNHYPTNNSGRLSENIICGGAYLEWGVDGFICDGKTYLSILPEDPSAQPLNAYWFAGYKHDGTVCGGVGGPGDDISLCQTFVLSATLENPPDPSSLQCRPNPLRNYCVSSPR